MCELKKKSNKMLIMKVENKLRANSEKNKRFFFNIHDFDLLL